eukprot:Gregarina_sp_Pseudo_9__1897@NODE_22_length_5725_cov_32_771720_g20_i0_p2_GENE_NODE_22_length_5725_cov_32_771720_g20_i0NODE_22_length_5725_cov_32_771720_g20_i0_p2_ORF_typecomplete_len618_score113_39Fbox/PF00646_33/0_037C4bp_oligo/PF18453_1/0_11NMT_C/PF02799_15/67NMT_C/PF02799_15/8_6_NODE_22_length_5725_cov_32_771720_g20_i010562909
MALYKKRKPKIRWRRSLMFKVKEEEETPTATPVAPESNTELRRVLKGDAQRWIAFQRRALRRRMNFHLTTSQHETHHLITSIWRQDTVTDSSVADIRAKLLHRMHLSRSVHDVMTDLLALTKAQDIDYFTALVVLALYLLKGREDTMLVIQNQEFVDLEDFPKKRRVSNVFPPLSAWEYLQQALGVYSAFYALPTSLVTHFELVDPSEFKESSIAEALLENQFSNELTERAGRYKTIQAILISNITKLISLNDLLILLDDLCRFKHISLKSALAILVAFLIHGSRACSDMIALGVMVDCSKPPCTIVFDSADVPKENVFFNCLKFFNIEERFRFRTVCKAAHRVVFGPQMEEAALKEVLYLTNGTLNALMPENELDMTASPEKRRICRTAQSWHALGIMCMKRFRARYSEDFPYDVQVWIQRLKGLLLSAHGPFFISNTYQEGCQEVTNATHMMKCLVQTRDHSALSGIAYSTMAIKALLCFPKWREVILDVNDTSILPGQVLAWAGNEVEELCPPASSLIPDCKQAIRTHPKVYSLAAQELWYSVIDEETGVSEVPPPPPSSVAEQQLPENPTACMVEHLAALEPLVRRRLCRAFKDPTGTGLQLLTKTSFVTINP